ncbi:MAG: lipoprotein-releasing ABC transporter permease subunit [Gammaproteobacteria bacterium]|nr:lipoprotein-releasing ABC transporter permease subunit [Gammaproteobacteria bacterium]
MFHPASVFIGLRYTRAKKRNHFISFISLMSMLGIALGVLVLITVISVMNGFDREIQKQVFGMVSPITVTTPESRLAKWEDARQFLLKNPQIRGVAPFAAGQALLTHSGVVQPASVSGILPSLEKNMTSLDQYVIEGNLQLLKPHEFGIILGADLAMHLAAIPGDYINVITPQASLTPAGMLPRFKRFKVVGIFQAGNGFGFDSQLAFVHMQDAQTLFQFNSNVTGLHLKIDNAYAAPQLSRALSQELGPTATVSDWTDQFGAFFHAISLEKTMMFFILMLIVGVAVFNLVCTLVMVVNDKQSDIAILRTFGATPGMVMRIFMVQGAIIGVIGTLLGVLCGVGLATHVTVIVDGLERLFHVELLTSSVYFGLTHLPSDLQWMDVIRISVVALALSFSATLYPAFRAARIEPAEALRYE